MWAAFKQQVPTTVQLCIRIIKLASKIDTTDIWAPWPDTLGDENHYLATFKLQQATESPGRLLKSQIAGHPPHSSLQASAHH